MSTGDEMNSSISAERASARRGLTAVQPYGAERGLAQDPRPGSERRGNAGFDSCRDLSASPLIDIDHTLSA